MNKFQYVPDKVMASLKADFEEFFKEIATNQEEEHHMQLHGKIFSFPKFLEVFIQKAKVRFPEEININDLCIAYLDGILDNMLLFEFFGLESDKYTYTNEESHADWLMSDLQMFITDYDISEMFAEE